MQRQGFAGSLAESRTKSALEVAFVVHMREWGQSHILTYFQFQRGFSIQPDIQYIIRPGWFGQANNALVLGLQIAVEL
jgi:hypothetical protein